VSFHAILIDDVVLVVEYVVSVEPIHQLDRSGQPVLYDGAPKVIGSVVTMTPGNSIELAGHTPEQVGQYIATAVGGDRAVTA
jgi:hypothetical protein